MVGVNNSAIIFRQISDKSSRGHRDGNLMPSEV